MFIMFNYYAAAEKQLKLAVSAIFNSVGVGRNSFSSNAG
jgi:hypothetical protein